jgi:hypothetical protein
LNNTFTDSYLCPDLTSLMTRSSNSFLISTDSLCSLIAESSLLIPYLDKIRSAFSSVVI